MVQPAPINGLSVDVEDWFHVGAFESVIRRDAWDTLTNRIDRNCNLILGLLAEAEVQATFFTL
ncbi:MAG TPA: polysaccharide deacetylase family protein, partial [Novosphingobium sp.]|nr:polysaccharide deacetylase family protein [Novosphingobium sp.]